MAIRGNKYREHRFNQSCYREQGSRCREQDFRKSEVQLLSIVETFQFEISILAEGNRHTNMKNVVTVLTTGIDAAVSQVQQTEQQFQTTFDAFNLLRVKRICIGVNKLDSGTAGSKQGRCDEVSNEMKSMSIKICWKKDFIEKNTQNPQPAAAVGATKCSQNSATRPAGV